MDALIASVMCATVSERIDEMVRTARVRKPVELHAGDRIRVLFNSKVGLMVHGGYKLYKVIPSGSPLPALDETWDVDAITTWENTENRTVYSYTVVVHLVNKIA